MSIAVNLLMEVAESFFFSFSKDIKVKNLNKNYFIGSTSAISNHHAFTEIAKDTMLLHYHSI